MTRLVTIAVAGALMIAVAGCGSPAAPQKVNACLPDDRPVVQAVPGAGQKADTIVLAKCIRSNEYETTTSGDWVNSWCVTTWKVLKVEQGTWPESTLSFKFVDRWQMPKKGVPSMKPTPPYHVGAMRAFHIDTRRWPTIVADESRSQIPPHGPVSRPAYAVGSPESEVLYERISDAARKFTWTVRGVNGPAHVTEQYGHLFVVEVETLDDSFAVAVNDETMEASWAEAADLPK
jgi:hypothetical protein